MIRFKIIGPRPIRMRVDDAVQVDTGGYLTPYVGAYEVTPDVAAQTLATRDKRMLYDVRVREIPYHEVSNAAGTTAIIGGIAYYGSK